MSENRNLNEAIASALTTFRNSPELDDERFFRAFVDKGVESSLGFERSAFHMTTEKVIMLIEAKIQPQRRAGLVEAARQYLPMVRAQSGVEAFYITTRKDDPNTFVFYEIYRSQAAQDVHLQQDFTINFLATLKSAQDGDRRRTNLIELLPEGEAQPK